jgi:DNA (cytosine-5)-methyltransferase 1
MIRELTHGSLFSGIGGFELGAKNAGIKTVYNCEINEFCRKVLKKNFPEVKQYNDVTKLSKPEFTNIISGGSPCQNISIANSKEATGIMGSKSKLYFEFIRIVYETRPDYVLFENSSMLRSRGFERVLYDLSEIGYDAEWQCLSGTTFGIQQRRERLYCIAYPSIIRQKRIMLQPIFSEQILQRELQGIYPRWRTRGDIPAPRTIRSLNDISEALDRLQSIGNAIMPKVAKYLFECIKEFDQKINEVAA